MILAREVSDIKRCFLRVLLYNESRISMMLIINTSSSHN